MKVILLPVMLFIGSTLVGCEPETPPHQVASSGDKFAASQEVLRLPSDDLSLTAMVRRWILENPVNAVTLIIRTSQVADNQKTSVNLLLVAPQGVTDNKLDQTLRRTIVGA